MVLADGLSFCMAVLRFPSGSTIYYLPILEAVVDQQENFSNAKYYANVRNIIIFISKQMKT